MKSSRQQRTHDVEVAKCLPAKLAWPKNPGQSFLRTSNLKEDTVPAPIKAALD